jgi:hypothetical protein
MKMAVTVNNNNDDDHNDSNLVFTGWHNKNLTQLEFDYLTHLTMNATL